MFDPIMAQILIIARSAWGFLAGLLVIGFICNFFIKAVHHRFHMKPDHEAERAQAAVGAVGDTRGTVKGDDGGKGGAVP